MPTFNEADHNRNDATKQFAERNRGTPEATLPAPRKPGVLGGYEVRNYKKVNMGMEGGAFTATVYRDGKKAFLAENSGDGGENRYTPVIPASARRTQDMEVFKAIHISHCKETDAFNEMAVKALNEQPYGMTSDSFFELIWWHAQMEKDVAKNNWDRSTLIELSIEANDKNSPYPLSEREKEILRNPDVLDQK